MVVRPGLVYISRVLLQIGLLPFCSFIYRMWFMPHSTSWLLWLQIRPMWEWSKKGWAVKHMCQPGMVLPWGHFLDCPLPKSAFRLFNSRYITWTSSKEARKCGKYNQTVLIGHMRRVIICRQAAISATAQMREGWCSDFGHKSRWEK